MVSLIKSKKDLLDRLINAPVSFYDNTPKDIIMRRFNGNVGQVCSLIHKVFHTTHETVRIGTTVYFIV
jgi:hypothetical protein